VALLAAKNTFRKQIAIKSNAIHMIHDTYFARNKTINRYTMQQKLCHNKFKFKSNNGCLLIVIKTTCVLHKKSVVADK